MNETQTTKTINHLKRHCILECEKSECKIPVFHVLNKTKALKTKNKI